MKNQLVNKKYTKMLKSRIKRFESACLTGDTAVAMEAMRDAQSVASRCSAKHAIKANKRNRIISTLFTKFNCTFNNTDSALKL